MADKTFSGQKGNRMVISGKRGDAVFPPSVLDLQTEDDRRSSDHEGENNVVIRSEEFPSGGTIASSRFGGLDGDEFTIEPEVKKDVAIRPPQDIPVRGTIESLLFGGLDGDERSLLSIDRLSLPSDQDSLHDADTCLAVSCGDREKSMKRLKSCLYNNPPSLMVDLVTATPIETTYQQASDAHERSLSRPHIPKQDTSPHESLEQGNSTCIATSPSICEKQVEYRREENYKFPKMENYENCLKTFEKYQWPLSSPSPEKLAEAGMFYEGKTYNYLQPCCRIDKHHNMISS